MPARIYLSPPHLGTSEQRLVEEAFESNWVAPAGPHLQRFEEEFAGRVGTKRAVAVASGTAALHLSLRLLGVRAGDEVLCSTFTFVASANPILYQGADPVFIDSEPGSWNLDPELLREELKSSATRGKLPKAVVVVDVLGQCADYDRILPLCQKYGVPVIEDAAESLGATYKGSPAGSFGKVGVFSFNGNKIITTSGGGMLVSDDVDLITRATYLATQARDPVPYYQHSALGYNYRLSNVLAAIGLGQLQVLDHHVQARRSNFDYYRKHLSDLQGISFMPEAPCGRATRWLTCIQIDPQKFGCPREEVRLALEHENIESRPLWKPMHLQPVFKDCRFRENGVSESIFAKGLCLPSGSGLTKPELDRVCRVVRKLCNRVG